MPFYMEDMNALESEGGGCCQKASSSSASNSYSEEDSTWAFSGWTLGVHTACKQLLYVLVIHSDATNTRSYELKTCQEGNSYTNKSLIWDANIWHL